VVVLWDLAQVFPEIAAEEPIASLRAQIAGRAPDETVSERVALGQMVHSALQRRRAQICAQVTEHLRGLSEDLIINPTMDESMVANVALLIDASRQGDLDAGLDVLDAQFGGQLQFRCVGPLPPYSFATLEVQTLPFDLVDAARQELGLGHETCLSEIKRAYRQRATQAHPDRNPDPAHAAAQMDALTGAYQLLSTLAKAQAPAGEAERSDGRMCQLDRESVEQTLLVAIVRQERAL
jgi:hypothetical protein